MVKLQFMQKFQIMINNIMTTDKTGIPGKNSNIFTEEE